jgi:hypothetical protein
LNRHTLLFFRPFAVETKISGGLARIPESDAHRSESGWNTMAARVLLILPGIGAEGEDDRTATPTSRVIL